MPEVTEDPNATGFDLKRYLDIVRRRHLQFLIPAFLGWLIVWGTSWVLPVRYKSSTLILVEQPTMPKNYVEANVSDDLQNRLQSITQQILSRTRLLVIIDKLHLYNGGRKHLTPDDKAALLARDIAVELVHDARGEEITAFRITYSAHDPRIAQAVTSEVKDLFIQENLKVRQQESADTTKFIEAQLETARQTLADQEAKIREFEGAHEGELPSQQASNLQILSGYQSQLQNEQDSLNTAKQQRVYYETLIEQYRNLHGKSGSGTAPGDPSSLTAIDLQLDKLNAQLADMSSRYTENHPDIQSLKSDIARTEKMRADLVAGLRTKGASGNRSGTTTESSEGTTMLQLQGQLQANQTEIANREQAIEALKGKINAYQERLNNEPVREQQLADLTRGDEQSKANYDDLLKKKNQSEMATSMERMQQGERFSMLDPPSLPVKPDFPNRLKFCGIGMGVGVVLGILVVAGLEVFDDRMHTEEAIKVLLPMAVISEIPEIVSPSDERRVKKRMMLGWATATVVAATILAGSAISYLHE